MSRVLQQLELEMPSSVWLERVSSFSKPKRHAFTKAGQTSGQTLRSLRKRGVASPRPLGGCHTADASGTVCLVERTL